MTDFITVCVWPSFTYSPCMSHCSKFNQRYDHHFCWKRLI